MLSRKIIMVTYVINDKAVTFAIMILKVHVTPNNMAKNRLLAARSL